MFRVVFLLVVTLKKQAVLKHFRVLFRVLRIAKSLKAMIILHSLLYIHLTFNQVVEGSIPSCLTT